MSERSNRAILTRFLIWNATVRVMAASAPALSVAVQPARPQASRQLLRAAAVLAIAAGGVAVVWLVGWRGSDIPAQLYRVDLFRSSGFALWDNHWYAGHYLLSYSALFPPFGAVIGIYGAAAVAAGAAAWAVDQLLRDALGARSFVAAAAFAVALVVPVAIGQLPFLCGEAAGLVALVSLRHHHRLLAVIFAALCTLFSPVAGVFFLIVMAATAITEHGMHRRTAVLVAAAAAVPLVLSAAVFPDPGTFPYSGAAFAATVGTAAAIWLVCPREWRALRVGVVIYGLVAIGDFVIPNALGGNYQRLALALSPALVLASATRPRRRWVALLALPLLVWQWSPALPAFSSAPGAASSHASYYQPVVAYLKAQPVGRVEIPFTQAHWETAYVAPQVPLARGWERQLDIADNPIFYASTSLTAITYQRWLIDQGVTWVAMPDAALDYSSRAEGALLRADAVPDLHEVWHNDHWTVWRVGGSPGIVSAPAHLVSLGTSDFVVDAPTVGRITVRVHFTPSWDITSGHGCVQRSNRGWTELVVRKPGRIEVDAALGSGSACPSP
jgi:hypothetical protein